MWRRREFAAAAISLASIVATTGCTEISESPNATTSIDNTTGRTEQTTTSSQTGVSPEDDEWGGLEITNLSSEKVTLVVEVSRNEEVLFKDQVSLQGDGHEGFQQVVESEGEYLVKVNVEDGPTKSKEVAYDDTTHLVSIYVDYEEIRITPISA